MPQSYYITDRHSTRTPLLHQIRIAIEAGVDLVQLREKDLPSRELFELAVAVRDLAVLGDCKVLVNDRLDIALAARLHGVHLGQASIPPEIIRRKVPDGSFLVAVSTHTLEELKRAQGQSVSFVTFGPVYETPSKLQFGPPVGMQSLQEACRLSKVPVIALGGINEQNFSECLRRGASGIAGISMFQRDLNTVSRVVRQIRRSE